MATGVVERRTVDLLDFGYRHSAIGPDEIVIGAELGVCGSYSSQLVSAATARRVELGDSFTGRVVRAGRAAIFRATTPRR